MPLIPLQGHEKMRAALAKSVRENDLPHSLLLHGPEGIGKERFGLWLAQRIVCDSPDTGTEPCGHCLHCRLVERLEHPDVNWFFPLPRPEATGPDRLREKLEESRAAELVARRADPFHVPAYERAPAYFLAAIRTLQELAGNRPAMGSRKVFVVGEAEAMVPQESSQEAANAFLKLLEEPPADTTLILTSSTPGALLPTIRSRVLPVRLLPSGDGPGPLERQRQAGRALLLAATADQPTARLAAALAEAPTGGRGEFSGTLEAFSLWLRDLMAAASGAEDLVVNGGDVAMLSQVVRRRDIRPPGVGRALDRVQRAAELASGNVNPQLILADLLRGVRRDLLNAA
jgi:DNA polymerase-3 subunit delta'